MFGLPGIREVIALDTEYLSGPGAIPYPVCVVARELGAGRTHRIWLADDRPPEPPWVTGDDVLFVAYAAWAEWGVLLELGWPMPTRVLDLYIEYLRETNGRRTGGTGLLAAASFYGITSITKDEKRDMRDLILSGGPWSVADRSAILDYCESDVTLTARLLDRMLLVLNPDPVTFGQAMLRGRYSVAVARMERTGTPMDAELLGRLVDNLDEVKAGVIKEIDRDFGVFDGLTFKAGLFAEYVALRGMSWQRTATGKLRTDEDTFRDQCKLYPDLERLRQALGLVRGLNMRDFALGPDDRNRAFIWPFGTTTGRNNMTRRSSSGHSPWGPATWVRGFIRPEPGRALAYLDWSSQEIAIAAALSGDSALLSAYQSGDPYLWFAIAAGLAPEGATKASHPAIRDTCKVSLLGLNYGMQAEALAARTGLSVIEARAVMRDLARVFATFTAWADEQVNRALITGGQATELGWSRTVRPTDSANALRNWPIQSGGAEMLRLACCMVTEAGIEVCAPVHDALMIEATEAGIDKAVDQAAELMREASRLVLGGVAVRVDTKVTRFPDRYMDGRGADMWAKVSARIPGGPIGPGTL